MRLLSSAGPLAILFAQIALFTAALFVRKTRLYEEHDSTGIKTALSYQIISAVLVSNSGRLSRLGFIHRMCGYKLNSIANLICLILAIVLEKFYEKSLSSLGFALSITVSFLMLLAIIRPSTDLGLFGFLIGVIVSVAYNVFGLKFQTWIVLAICFPLLCFRCWLDKNWLELGEDQSQLTARRNQISMSEIIEAVTVAGFHLFWVYNWFRTNCRKIKGPPKSISCTSSPIVGMLASVLIFNLWFGIALTPRVCSLFQTKTASSPIEPIVGGRMLFRRDGAPISPQLIKYIRIDAANYSSPKSGEAEEEVPFLSESTEDEEDLLESTEADEYKKKEEPKKEEKEESKKEDPVAEYGKAYKAQRIDSINQVQGEDQQKKRKMN